LDHVKCKPGNERRLLASAETRSVQCVPTHDLFLYLDICPDRCHFSSFGTFGSPCGFLVFPDGDAVKDYFVITKAMRPLPQHQRTSQWHCPHLEKLFPDAGQFILSSRKNRNAFRVPVWRRTELAQPNQLFRYSSRVVRHPSGRGLSKGMLSFRIMFPSKNMSLQADEESSIPDDPTFLAIAT
jgi:hypothetical protein